MILETWFPAFKHQYREPTAEIRSSEILLDSMRCRLASAREMGEALTSS